MQPEIECQITNYMQTRWPGLVLDYKGSGMKTPKKSSIMFFHGIDHEGKEISIEFRDHLDTCIFQITYKLLDDFISIKRKNINVIKLFPLLKMLNEAS